MTRVGVVAGVGTVVLVGLSALFLVRPAPEGDGASVAPAAAGPPEAQPGFLYGRAVGDDDIIYEGRLRLGGDQEAFWGDFFNGRKTDNPWDVHVPGRREERGSIEILGLTIGGDDRTDLARPFMSRFGDIARIETSVSETRVTLKSSTTIVLDRFSAGDIDDGVRVWDRQRGVVDLDPRSLHRVEFLPTPPLAGAPARLHGTVRTRLGDFTGFIAWNQQDAVGADEFEGGTNGGDERLRYDTIRSIARQSPESARVTLVDGREIVLSGSVDTGRGHRGVYVDDARYGRVLIAWDVFERVDFSARGSGPGYDDFARGRALRGHVTTRNRRLGGRLVYDFDESETTETLDVVSPAITYNIPFDLIAAIVRRDTGGDARRATVLLRSGEALHLERTGDLAETNAGILVFADGRDEPEYLRWRDVERIDLEPPNER